MLPAKKSSRLLFCGAAVALACGLAVIAARGFQKPYTSNSPPYRQKGNPAAKVVIVEYSDIQCPACAAAVGVLKNIVSLYGNDVLIVYKHFPLERRHLNARQAARAAECAGRQSKFWELHDILYEKQNEWAESGDPRWVYKYAASLALEEKSFSACLADPAVNAAIDADIQEGNNQWVGSTPTFFINGKRFIGARQLSVLGSIWIEKQLKK